MSTKRSLVQRLSHPVLAVAYAVHVLGCPTADAVLKILAVAILSISIAAALVESAASDA